MSDRIKTKAITKITHEEGMLKMAIEFKNAGEIVTPWTSWFFYGATRAGKTTAAATFPRPVFLVPAQEKSHISLMGRHDVDYKLIESSHMMHETVAELEARHQRARPLWDTGSEDALAEADTIFPWQTVVLESMTHYADLIQEELTRGATVEMDRQKWGKLGSHLRSIHMRLRALPVHTIFTSLEDRIHDEKGKLVSGGPMFPGKTQFKMPSACDGIVYFERKAGNPNDIFLAHFTKQEVFVAGTRFPRLTAKRSLKPFTWAEVAETLGW